MWSLVPIVIISTLLPKIIFKIYRVSNVMGCPIVGEDGYKLRLGCVPGNGQNKTEQCKWFDIVFYTIHND